MSVLTAYALTDARGEKIPCPAKTRLRNPPLHFLQESTH